MSGLLTHITIPDETPEVTYVASDGQTAFAIPFRFFATTDIQVAVDGALLSAGYTITGTAVDAGYSAGTLTLSDALEGGEAVLIYRDIPVERTSDFPSPSQTLEVRTLNTELDRIIAILQDERRRGQRLEDHALRVPMFDPAIPTFPTVADRAGKIVAFDGEGNPTVLDITLNEDGTIGGIVGAQGPPGEGRFPGEIIEWPSNTLPPKCLWANGAAVSRTTYAAVFAFYGTAHGAGDGVTTFNLPNKMGRTGIGREGMGGAPAPGRITAAGCGIDGTVLGATGGSQHMQQHPHPVIDPGHPHTVTINDPGHPHSMSGSQVVAGPTGVGGEGTGGTGGEVLPNTTGITAAANTNTTGITIGNAGTGAAGNVQPGIVMNYIVYMGVEIGPGGEVITVASSYGVYKAGFWVDQFVSDDEELFGDVLPFGVRFPAGAAGSGISCREPGESDTTIICEMRAPTETTWTAFATYTLPAGEIRGTVAIAADFEGGAMADTRWRLQGVRADDARGIAVALVGTRN